MADDKSNSGAQDRSRLSGSETYELDHFARKHGISHDMARALIARHGNNRETLDAAAEALLGTHDQAN